MDNFWRGFLLICSISLLGWHLFDSRSAQHVHAELTSDADSVRPGNPFVLGLRLEMERGWHTYWKNPGDSGMPTQIDWDVPEGVVAGETRWPYPEKLEMSGLVSYGYEGEVVLLTEFQTRPTLKPGSKIEITAHVEWLVCKEECIPGRDDLSIELPVRVQRPKRDGRWASLFDRTRKNLPRSLDDWKIDATWAEEMIDIHIQPPASFGRKIKDILFFPEQEGIIQYAEPQLLTKVKNAYVIELKRSQVSAALPSRLRGVLVAPSGWDSAGQVKALHVDVPLKALE
jgi:DsbC/DsbD-like thiol-disulfide interchange protein